MTAIKLDGELVASELKHDLRTRIEALADRGVTPGLGTLLVGDDGPSANYVSMKHRDSEDLGMSSREIHLPSTATQAEVEAVVQDFNNDPSVDAYIIQYPFPKGLDYESALIKVLPEKDADGLHPVNLGKLVQGIDAPVACTPAGIQLLLNHYDVPIKGKHVVIVGRVHPTGRHLDRCCRCTPHDQGRHGQAWSRSRGCRSQLRRPQAGQRRRRSGRRSRRLVVAPYRWGRPHDPRIAYGQHRRGRRAFSRLIANLGNAADMVVHKRAHTLAPCGRRLLTS